MTKRRIRGAPEDRPRVDLDDLNQTELVILAEEAGHFEAHRDLSKEQLIELITMASAKDPIYLGARVVHIRRLQIMKHIRDVWEQVAPTIQACPARSGSPTACFTCTDHQVAFCIDQNVHLTTTKLDEEDMAVNLTNFVPKTRAEWTAIAESQDPIERSQTGKALMALGMGASDLTRVTDRVGKIMELQAEHGLSVAGEDKPKVAKAGKAAAVAPKAAAVVPAKAAATPVASGSGMGNAELLGLLKQVVAKQIEQDETLANLGATLAEMDSFVKETHCLARMQAALVGVDMEEAGSLLGELGMPEEDEGND